VRKYGQKVRDFCCDDCRKAHKARQKKLTGNHRRRARYYGVPYEPVDVFKVFERDDWHCHLCGVRTPKKLRGTLDDRAPELDHIVPLAAGGAHSYGNTACCCRKCNIEKGARPIGQPSFDFGDAVYLPNASGSIFNDVGRSAAQPS
jgi:5-methylcytosine-specific restriction endonuclease McrA